MLKRAVRDTLAGDVEANGAYTELLEFESRVDDLALLALDIYMRCRDKLYELRVGEVKAERDRALKLWERTGLISENQETKFSGEGM